MEQPGRTEHGQQFELASEGEGQGEDTGSRNKQKAAGSNRAQKNAPSLVYISLGGGSEGL